MCSDYLFWIALTMYYVLNQYYQLSTVCINIILCVLQSAIRNSIFEVNNSISNFLNEHYIICKLHTVEVSH